MSFGGGRLSIGERRALSYALRRDVVLIAAAADAPIAEQGHPAKDLQPTGTGSRLDAGLGLVVTAADMSGGRASFAGRGSQISLAAFGDTGPSGPAPGIFSTFPANVTQIETGASSPPAPPCPACRTTFNGDNRYGYLAGTSMAAPQVAGAVALVRAANPKLRRGTVVRLMKETASRAGGWTTELGWGILNAEACGAAGPRARTGHRPAEHQPARNPQPACRPRLHPAVAGAGPGPTGHPAGRGGVLRRLRPARGPLQAPGDHDANRYRYRGRRGKRYSFHVRARDRAGNIEAPPSRPDFLVRVRR